MATRRAGKPPHGSNGMGLSASRTDQWLTYWLRNYPLLNDPPDLPVHWRRVVRVFNVLGKKSHDARLAAAAQAHHIPTLLTFNTKDFHRFPVLQLLDPRSL